jgi:hypothetical protein
LINSKILWTLALSAITLLALYFFTDIRWKSVAVEIENLSWKSGITEEGNRQPIRYKTKDNSKYKSFNILFGFKANSLEDYPNILQTAALNSGIRLELTQPSTLQLIIGGTRGMLVTDKLTPGKWHEIEMDISRAGHVLVSIDGITAIDETRQLQYKVDEILIGSGFSETRPFVGEIEIDSISYKSFEKNSLLIRAMLYWVIFVFIVIAANCTKIFIEVAPSLTKAFVRVIISDLRIFVRVIISCLRKFVRAMIKLDNWLGH